MLLKLDGLDALEAGVNWAGADGSTDKDVGPMPEMDIHQESGVKDQRTRYDKMFGEFRGKLVEHFIYKAERRQLAWTYTSSSSQT